MMRLFFILSNKTASGQGNYLILVRENQGNGRDILSGHPVKKKILFSEIH